MGYITLFGRTLPAYGLLGAAAFVLGLVYLFLACRANALPFDDAVYVLLWGAIAAMGGAKLLYLIGHAGELVRAFSEEGSSKWELIRANLQGGFVFYGGLIGGIAGARLAARYFHLDFSVYGSLCIPVLPLVQGFGRIGCHLIGCCHGVEYDGPFSVVYQSSEFAPNGVPLFPAQLCESGFDFLLFLALAGLVFFGRRRDRVIHIYLIAYATERFFLEFLRGDEIRGFVLGVSTSQWISLAILLTEALLLLKRRRKLRAAAGSP